MGTQPTPELQNHSNRVKNHFKEKKKPRKSATQPNKNFNVIIKLMNLNRYHGDDPLMQTSDTSSFQGPDPPSLTLPIFVSFSCSFMSRKLLPTFKCPIISDSSHTQPPSSPSHPLFPPPLYMISSRYYAVLVAIS